MPCRLTDKEGRVNTFDNLNSFNDLTTPLIRNVAEEQDRAPVLALLARLEKISAPNAGAPKILLLLCAVARYSRWLPGQMHVELMRKAERTVVDIQVDDGDFRERLGRKLTLAAPLDEFVETARKLDEHPEKPLKVMLYRRQNDALTGIELMMVVPVRAYTAPPPEMAERVMSATIVTRASSHPPRQTRKKEADITPSILPVVRPDARKPASSAPAVRRPAAVKTSSKIVPSPAVATAVAPPPSAGPRSAGPASQPIDTDDVDDGW